MNSLPEIRRLAAFSHAGRGGNPAGVVIAAELPDPGDMQRIARGGDEPERLLIEKAVQNRAWEECDRAAGSEGRKQLQKRLRGLVAALDKAC